MFDSQAGIIIFENTGTIFERAFLIAHELGHIVLEGSDQDDITEHIEPDRPSNESPTGIGKVIDYGMKERREVRMDIFAREFLLPRSVVRQLHVYEHHSSRDIANSRNIPLPIVQQQLLDALLLPIIDFSPQRAEPLKSTILNVDQIQAIKHRKTAFQLQAGPGTGKTRTLVSRIESLIIDGVDPTSILVLTFSNKAAQELVERLAMNNSVAAAAMWIGTFHAFGFDIIHRFHDKLGLPPNPHLLDRLDAIELLEDEFPRLPFKHYRNLWDATLDLGDMLNAISRAKDEVIDAEGYQLLAASMLEKTENNKDALTRAEKCCEVASLYKCYEKILEEKQLIDFGDLVAMPVKLVENDTDVRRALQFRHKYILVDEYQDVNRASVRLLKAIAGDGQNLWVVGDARQSIYRFRGASATNMERFTKDFPNAQVNQLKINYRSVQEVVETFTTFSKTMEVSNSTLPLQLEANRGKSGNNPSLQIVGTANDEVSAIASEIQTQRNNGIYYKEQTILCVSNNRLNEIAIGLEERGIPILHLGSLFERSEIKDLLSLLSVITDPHAIGLVRVATMPTHEIELQDIVQIIKHLKKNDAEIFDWKQAGNQIADITEDSKNKLATIADFFEKIKPSDNPWSILVELVIEKLGLAKKLYLTGDYKSQMQGLALWQFLNFCRNQHSGTGIPSARLLERIRRLVLLSEDRSLRQLPSAAENIDAVRLMTIHASKGLEFNIVHLPGMVTSGIPRKNNPPRCPPPDGLIYGTSSLSGYDAVKTGHNAEEECLFFVALSRARNRLFLYATSLQSNGRRRNLSSFISPIKHLLSQSSKLSQTTDQVLSNSHIPIEWQNKPQWNESQINLFERCPRRFFYTHIIGLGGHKTETAFMKMHNVVQEVFCWLKTNHEITTPCKEELDTCFNETWQAMGATSHGYADDYYRIGRRLVDYLSETRNAQTRTTVKTLLLNVSDGELLVTPDNVAENESGQIIVQRVKTGKPRSNEFDDIEYTIMHLATTQAYGKQTQIEVVYLTTEETKYLSLSDQKLDARRKKLNEIVQNIYSGYFPAKKEARTCPRCSNFFICKDLPSNPLKIKKC